MLYLNVDLMNEQATAPLLPPLRGSVPAEGVG
jgi:hypothetical protein